ncbi:MAG: hypothetical protein QXT53_07300 [Ignisphaera sp.]
MKEPILQQMVISELYERLLSMQHLIGSAIERVIIGPVNTPDVLLELAKHISRMGMFRVFANIDRVVEGLKIPLDIVIKSYVEVVRRGIELSRIEGTKLVSCYVDAYEDFEEGWKAISIRVLMMGDSQKLQKIWSELSKKVADTAKEFARYIYVEVEPAE